MSFRQVHNFGQGQPTMQQYQNQQIQQRGQHLQTGQQISNEQLQQLHGNYNIDHGLRNFNPSEHYSPINRDMVATTNREKI